MSPKEDTDAECKKLQKEIEDLKEKIKASQKNVRDKEFEQVMVDLREAPKLKVVVKRMLKGHIHKVNGVAFAGDSRLEVGKIFRLCSWF